MTATHLLLIRHAATDTMGKQLTGWTPGVHLNADGRMQANALATRLAGIPLAAVYSSPLERALETAQQLAQARGLSVQEREGLGELRTGDWTGRNLEELRQEELWSLMQGLPSGARFPGGESLREAQSRMVGALDTIRDGHPGQHVAVVSHADPIKLAVAYYLGLALDLFQRLSIDPASVTVVAFARHGPRILCINHTELLPCLKSEEA